MLGIGSPTVTRYRASPPIKFADRELRSPPARAGSFFDPQRSFASVDSNSGLSSIPPDALCCIGNHVPNVS